jgi:hypothetical protein
MCILIVRFWRSMCDVQMRYGFGFPLTITKHRSPSGDQGYAHELTRNSALARHYVLHRNLPDNTNRQRLRNRFSARTRRLNSTAPGMSVMHSTVQQCNLPRAAESLSCSTLCEQQGGNRIHKVAQRTTCPANALLGAPVERSSCTQSLHRAHGVVP